MESIILYNLVDRRYRLNQITKTFTYNKYIIKQKTYADDIQLDHSFLISIRSGCCQLKHVQFVDHLSRLSLSTYT